MQFIVGFEVMYFNAWGRPTPVAPNLFSLAYPLAAYFHKLYRPYLQKSVINIVAATSNLYVDVRDFFPAIIQFFSRTPKCPGSYPWGYAYPSLGITGLHDRHMQHIWQN